MLMTPLNSPMLKNAPRQAASAADSSSRWAEDFGGATDCLRVPPSPPSAVLRRPISNNMQTRMRIGVRPGRAEMDIERAHAVLKGLRGAGRELRQRGGCRIRAVG